MKRLRDEAAVGAFLARYADSSMFLLARLHRVGLSEAAPDGGTWVGRDPLDALVCHARSGLIQPQAPVAAEELGLAVVEASGREVRGLVGPAEQVARIRRALGLDGRPTRQDLLEELMALSLGSLAAGGVRRATRADRALLVDWRAHYEIEANGHGRLDAAAVAAEVVDRLLAEGLLFVTEGLDAMCTFNARIPGQVQVGGVYTPPDRRGRGHARACVAGALSLARAEGVRRAVLFVARDNPAARRAYAAIGFRGVGDFAVTVF